VEENKLGATAWMEVVDRLRLTALKLQNDEELNIDDKKALSDLYRYQLADSKLIWFMLDQKITLAFDAVYMQLGCNNLEYNDYSISEHSGHLECLRQMKMTYRYDVGIICSVRTGADKEYIESYVEELEKHGFRVFYPGRDTNQVDETGGIRICRDNDYAFMQCHEIHVIFHPESQGTLFDLGLCFNKPMKVVNPITRTENKSFKNVLLSWQEQTKKDVFCNIEFDKEIDVR